MKRSPVKLKTGFSVEHSRFIEYLFLYEFEGLSETIGLQLLTNKFSFQLSKKPKERTHFSPVPSYASHY